MVFFFFFFGSLSSSTQGFDHVLRPRARETLLSLVSDHCGKVDDVLYEKGLLSVERFLQRDLSGTSSR